MPLFVGVKIVFRVGLVLLKQMLGSVDKLRELQGMYETMERLRNISPDTIKEDLLVQEVGLFLLFFPDHKQNLLLFFLLSDTSYESLCPLVLSYLHFLCLYCPCLLCRPDCHTPCDGGAHREGVQHPSEEVEGVQRGADTPARTSPSRHEGHLWIQTPCCLHQLRRQLLFPREPNPSTRTPQVLLQPPLTPWLPQV